MRKQDDELEQLRAENEQLKKQITEMQAKPVSRKAIGDDNVHSKGVEAVKYLLDHRIPVE